MTGTFASQILASQLTKLRVNERDELVEGRFTPVSPRDEELGHLPRRS
jgi:hypothetical protein